MRAETNTNTNTKINTQKIVHASLVLEEQGEMKEGSASTSTYSSQSLLLLRVHVCLLGRRAASADLIPGALEVKVAELLSQLERLCDHALQLIVVAHLRVAPQREVLAERMAFKAVVCEHASQVGVVAEVHAKEVPHLALRPVGAVEDRGDRVDRRQLVRVGLHHHASVVCVREQAVDNLEAVLAGRHVDSGQLNELAELRCGVVAQEREDLHNRGWCDEQLEIALAGDAGLLDVFGQSLREVLCKGIEAGALLRHLRGVCTRCGGGSSSGGVVTHRHKARRQAACARGVSEERGGPLHDSAVCESVVCFSHTRGTAHWLCCVCMFAVAVC
eukprot:m.197665 g.197665  ORF g.197665 m.197665 type:complete len:331 (+) comp17668_c0_seq2:146-1138(+)